MADDIYRYLCELCQTTRTNPLIELGVSPRGSVALMRISKAIAFLHGRDYVIPGISMKSLDVAAHRLVRSAKAKAAKRSAESILIEVMQNVKSRLLQDVRKCRGTDEKFYYGIHYGRVVVYVALIYHSTGMLYCAVWIVCFLLLLLGFHLLFSQTLVFF